ncbi:hypothetical protein FP026_06435 [Rhizobium tropici]|uniref:Uncharacterized protein n=1 Tax=Rhizobium tropici TaxID=398 RepID=A0A5B0WA89_RHITR|nr:hypothetical protein [Rhizobium tropici]KAA1183672.1 hypothetical protein FP026_06435 [Rhizobium tropici]
MEFINRYVDRPLLDCGAMALRTWHEHTGQSPQKLAPFWNLIVILLLLSASSLFLAGSAYRLIFVALLMLSIPSLRVLAFGRSARTYNIRAYRALAAIAVRKREAEWAVRLTVLFTSVAFPFCVHVEDQTTALFLLGASLWFALIVPARLYLEAAEPPPPADDGRKVSSRETMFAA